jgi:predicted aspartyl protease
MICFCVQIVAAAEAPIAIPFKIEHQKVLVTGRIGKARTRFVVDTGASGTTVEGFVIRSAGISMGNAEAQYFAGVNSTGKFRQVRVPEIAFGDLILKNKEVAVYDQPVAVVGPGGLLGMDILGKYVVTFDFANNQLLLDSHLTEVPDNSVTIPMAADGGPFLTGLINGRLSKTLLLDTGSHWPLYLNPSDAKEAGLLLDDGTIAAHANKRKKQFVVDVNLSVKRVPQIVLKTLDVGTVRLVDVDAAIVEGPSDDSPNILGLPFIQKFAQAIFDFPNRRLILVRKPQPSVR